MTHQRWHSVLPRRVLEAAEGHERPTGTSALCLHCPRLRSCPSLASTSALCNQRLSHENLPTGLELPPIAQSKIRRLASSNMRMVFALL
jgi:hypothetical protein